MESFCITRLLKNARFLQSPSVGYLPRTEPLDGFQSIIPAHILRRLERIPIDEVQIERLAKIISVKRPPRAGGKLATPLFSGTLQFVSPVLTSGGTSHTIPDADLKVAIDYSRLAVVPISRYASQYGPNSLAVSDALLPLAQTLTGGKYNDGILSGWVDELAKSSGFGAGSCIMLLNPQGVVNTDADATQGVLGYHSISSSGVPYAFVNVMGKGLTIDDKDGLFALPLSHEIAEMTVDPEANGGNPEVSDPCAGNCNVDFRNYFDAGGDWLGPTATPGYSFFVDGVAKPEVASRCPAPESSCSYPPPAQSRTGRA